MFILCTYVDAERWTSAFEPLLYPSGLSFYRPFSYKDTYLHPRGLATELASPQQSDKLIADPDWNQGWFGIRFSKQSELEFRKKFVPLRQVTLVAAERLDEINLTFKLGPYVVPVTSNTDGSPEFPLLELTGILEDLSATKLFIKLENSVSLVCSKWKVGPEFPAGFWPAVERQLSPPVSDKLHNTLLLRLNSLKERGSATGIVPKALDAKGATWGYELRQRSAYDVGLTHYRLKHAGGPVAIVEHQYRIGNPPDEISASRRYIGLLGNYRADSLWVSPSIAGAGPIEIAIEPRRLKAPEEVVDQTTDKVIGLRIPVLVKPKKWDRKRYLNLGTTLISGLLSIYLLTCYFKPTATDDGRKVLLGLIAIFASLCLNALKDLLVPDK